MWPNIYNTKFVIQVFCHQTKIYGLLTVYRYIQVALYCPNTYLRVLLKLAIQDVNCLYVLAVFDLKHRSRSFIEIIDLINTLINYGYPSSETLPRPAVSVSVTLNLIRDCNLLPSVISKVSSVTNCVKLQD